MPELPPLELVLDVIRHIFVPAGATAMAVFALIQLTEQPREAMDRAGAALGLTAGLLVGNLVREALPWWVPTPGWQTLLWVVVAGSLMGALVRRPGLPAWAAWILRALASGMAAWVL